MDDSSSASILGFDIGGANLKWYHAAGLAGSMPFAMWQHPQRLSQALVTLARRLPPADQWLVTMTGEMADIFADRCAGVQQIVAQTLDAATVVETRKTDFYSIEGTFVSGDFAKSDPIKIASANWHALAASVAEWIDRPSLLIDIGSTTSDIIPISPRSIDTTSQTDHERLMHGELVYLGGQRTPVSSLVQTLPYAGRWIPIMRERFADMDDCRLLLGMTDEDTDDLATCDGRSRTRHHAASRMARMIGLDGINLSASDVQSMALHTLSTVQDLLMIAIKAQPNYNHRQWILAGHASSMLLPPPGIHVIELASRFDANISRVGPAYAIVDLWRRRIAAANGSMPT
jgi:(4-(4-[2-(gamma-L-glutamylamino)ethyl]phenoxymethyl)furan-2-yl)methanamine synthase